MTLLLLFRLATLGLAVLCTLFGIAVLGNEKRAHTETGWAVVALGYVACFVLYAGVALLNQ